MIRTAVVLALLCVACGRAQLNVDALPRLAGSAGVGASVANGNGSAFAGAGTSSDRPAARGGLSARGEAGANGSAEAGSDPAAEAWVGELWVHWPPLCDPDDPAPSPLTSTPEGQTYRVVLLLDPDADPAAPTGQIRIGDGEVPTEPEVWPANDMYQNPFWWCAHDGLTKGAQYTLLSASRTANRLRFRLTPAEVWRSWCSHDDDARTRCRQKPDCQVYSECACDASGCRETSSDVSFDFNVRGDTMDAAFPSVVYAAIRLQRVQ